VRLTLRTLLAYLDDILEPAQTKEIGSKLTESQFASDLVQRIREVMRRRRLTAPDVDGRDGSLDANVMAEYLDNTLSPEAVTDVEKRCLESDMHLAEAAACHQILTMVLGEPVEITPDSRRRMYGLVSQGSGDNQAAVAAGEVSKPEKEGDEIDDLAALPQAKDKTETIGSALPDYLKPRPFWRRALAPVVLVTAVVLFALLSITDTANNFGPGDLAALLGRMVGLNKAVEPAARNVAQSDQLAPVKVEPANPHAVSGKAGARDQTASKQANSAPRTPVIAPGTAASSEPPAPAVAQSAASEKKPAIDEFAPLAAGAPTSASAKPPVENNAKVGPSSPNAVSMIAPPTPAPTTPAPAPPESKPAATGGPSKVPSPPEPAPVAEPAPDVRLVSNNGILLGYDMGREDWYAVGRPGLTLPNPADSPDDVPKGEVAKIQVPAPPTPMVTNRRADQLVAPEPFDSQLEFGDKLCTMWLIGGTSVRLLAPSGSSRFGVELDQGRIVLRSGGSKMPAAEYRPLVVAVAPRPATAGTQNGELWQIEFLRPETQCGLEIWPDFPTKPGEDAKETSYHGTLYVVSGEIRLTESVGRQRTLSAGRWIPLAPGDRAVATDMNGANFRPKGSGPTPAWLTPDTHRLPTALLKIARDFEKDFLPDQPVSLSIGTIAKNERNPKVAELAVKTLALTGQYPTLVEVLGQVPHEEAVQAAANGLRTWLPLAADHGNLLQKELNTVFEPGARSIDGGMDDPSIVLRLLWGYNPEDGRDRATSNQLVQWLDHDKLAVRLLAIDQIARLTGQTLRYKASMRAGERKAIKKQWEQYVERHKGLLGQ